MSELVVDSRIDAAYLYVSSMSESRRSASTEPLRPDDQGGMINLDFDAEGHLVGIELFPATLYLRQQDIADAS